MRKLACLCLLFYLINSDPVNAYKGSENKLLIRSAVANGFQNGLHSKYLRYFADKISAEIEISEITFARRVQQLKSGQLDLMVGVQRTESREDEFVYISPHYETLKFRFYVLKERQNDFNKYIDLYDQMIGINRHAKYYEKFNKDENIGKYPLSTLKQNIELLLRKRIDSFIHYEESALPFLVELGLETKIVQMNYQPKHENRHYLVISSHSPLMKIKPQLEAIVIKAVENGDLLNIRLAHYRHTNE